jgi:hypothetical protein
LLIPLAWLAMFAVNRWRVSVPVLGLIDEVAEKSEYYPVPRKKPSRPKRRKPAKEKKPQPEPELLDDLEPALASVALPPGTPSVA